MGEWFGYDYSLGVGMIGIAMLISIQQIFLSLRFKLVQLWLPAFPNFVFAFAGNNLLHQNTIACKFIKEIVRRLQVFFFRFKKEIVFIRKHLICLQQPFEL